MLTVLYDMLLVLAAMIVCRHLCGDAEVVA